MRKKARITDSPVDSMFLIYERSHIEIVCDPVIESPDDRLVDPLSYPRFR